MRCPTCRAENPPGSKACEECGEVIVKAVLPAKAPTDYPVAQAQWDEHEIMDVLPVKNPEPEDDEDAAADDGGISTLIPYRNPQALAAYYLGLFALIPIIGLLTAPFAIVCGVLGVRAARRDKNAKGTVHALIGVLFGVLALSCSASILYLLIISKHRNDYLLFFTGGG
jgi:hypothetical protein